MIEDIYFFEVNTKNILSSVLKTSEFSRVLYNTQDKIDFGIHLKKVKFLFILYSIWPFTVIDQTADQLFVIAALS